MKCISDSKLTIPWFDTHEKFIPEENGIWKTIVSYIIDKIHICCCTWQKTFYSGQRRAWWVEKSAPVLLTDKWSIQRLGTCRWTWIKLSTTSQLQGCLSTLPSKALLDMFGLLEVTVYVIVNITAIMTYPFPKLNRSAKTKRVKQDCTLEHLFNGCNNASLVSKKKDSSLKVKVFIISLS